MVEACSQVLYFLGGKPGTNLLQVLKIMPLLL
jgi:hypothetical protein